jgi:hypothetical protein
MVVTAPARRRRSVAGFACCVAVGGGAWLTAGCGGSSPTPGLSAAAVRLARGAQTALQRWRWFPVDAEPRVAVMVGGRVQRPPAQNDKETHLLQIGSYKVAAKFPPAPEQRDGYRLISSTRAYHKLRILKPARAARRPALVIHRARLGRGRFPTDRPGTAYPAWLFYVRGANTPTRVLATPVFRPLPPLKPAQVPHVLLDTPLAQSAVVFDRGRRLRLTFAGGSPGNGPCDVNYTARTLSSRQAVAYAILPHPVPSKRACPAGAYEQSIVVTLVQPLARRVLIGANYGNAVPVTRYPLMSPTPGPRGPTS